MSRLSSFLMSLLLGMAILLMVGSADAAEVNRCLPDDTEVVAFVNVRQLLESPLVRKHALAQIKAVLKDNAELQKLLDAVGLDPLRDISSFTLAGPGKDLQTRSVLIMTGSFNVDKIHALADQIVKADANALKIHKQGNLRIYETRGQDLTGPAFAVFVDKNTLIVSPSRDSVSAASKAAHQTAPRIKRELQALIQQADSRHSMWFAAMATADLKEALKSNAQTAGVADRIAYLAGDVNLTSAAQAVIQIHATDFRSAVEVQRLMEAIKGFVQFAALSNKEYGPLFSDILDVMRVSSQRNVVTVGGKVTDELIDRGLKKGKKP